MRRPATAPAAAVCRATGRRRVALQAQRRGAHAGGARTGGLQACGRVGVGVAVGDDVPPVAGEAERQGVVDPAASTLEPPETACHVVVVMTWALTVAALPATATWPTATCVCTLSMRWPSAAARRAAPRAMRASVAASREPGASQGASTAVASGAVTAAPRACRYAVATAAGSGGAAAEGAGEAAASSAASSSAASTWSHACLCIWGPPSEAVTGLSPRL